MTAVISQQFHPNLAQTIYDEVQNRSSLYHYFIGKPLTWNDEEDPPLPLNHQKYLNDSRNNIVQSRQIQINDVALVVPRIDWVFNTIYDMYDDNLSSDNLSATGADKLKDSKFYVMTDDFNIYKCIFNNGGQPSTVKPSGTSTGNLKTSDGYIWKFMGFVPLSFQNKFLTAAFMPITKSVKNRYYSNGSIISYNILDGGSNYDPNETYLLIEGDGTGPSGADSSNVIEFEVSIGGNETGQFFEIDGVNQTQVIELVEGNTYRFDISSPSFLSNSDDFVFSSTSDLLTPYTSGVTQNANPGQPGAYVEIDVEEGAPTLYYYSSQNSELNGIIRTQPNSGPQGQADIDLVIENGVITGLIIKDGGYGYTDANARIVQGSLDPGSGANITFDLSTGDLDTQQANVELLAVDGSLSHIVIESPGVNYTNATVSISGDGTGAEATANIASNGEIESIDIVDYGSGYSYATANISGDGTGAELRVIISPQGGHGSNLPIEFLADSLCFYGSFENDPIQDFTINNDYRQIGIVKNISNYNSIYERFNGNIGSACFKINGTFDGANFLPDSTIKTSNNSKFFIVVSNEDNSLLIQSIDGSIPSVNDEIVDINDNNNFTITSVVSPTINKFSGDIMYLDNRQAFTPSSEQVVIFRTFIRF